LKNFSHPPGSIPPSAIWILLIFSVFSLFTHFLSVFSTFGWFFVVFSAHFHLFSFFRAKFQIFFNFSRLFSIIFSTFSIIFSTFFNHFFNFFYFLTFFQGIGKFFRRTIRPRGQFFRNNSSLRTIIPFFAVRMHICMTNCHQLNRTQRIPFYKRTL